MSVKSAEPFRKLRHFIKKQSSKPIVRFGSILVIAIIGVVLLAYSKAATFSVAIEPENGTASGTISSVTDSTASGGKAIQFGNKNTGLLIFSPQSELNQIKQAVTVGNKKTYWEYIKGRSSTRVNTANIWTPTKTTTYNGTTYTFDMTKYRSTDLADKNAANAEGSLIVAASQNAYGCALEWNIGGGDPACGDHAINILDSWAGGLIDVYCKPSGIDIRDNQIKLYSMWSIPNFTKAAELLWNNPNFTSAKKTKVANWLWTTFLLQNAQLQEIDSEILATRGGGWNGRISSLQSRLDAGLLMKAAGNTNGEAVISDIRNKINTVLPSILYYGKAPWHTSLGQPWPYQPVGISGSTTQTGIASYWQFITGSVLPPRFFIGQTQETGRDEGHTQMGIQGITEVLRSLRLNGYEDRFTKSDLGDILYQTGERHAKIYNEVLDKYWAGGFSSIDALGCNWQPSEWATLQLTAKTDCPAGAGAVSFKVGGTSADHGWELLRTELKSKGYSTPQLDKLVTRLRGTGTQSTSSVAGHGIIDFGNQLVWDPLFAPDYQ